MGTFRVKPRAKPRGGSRGSGSRSGGSAADDWSVSNGSTSSGVSAFRSAADELVREQQEQHEQQQKKQGPLDAHLMRNSSNLNRIEEGLKPAEKQRQVPGRKVWKNRAESPTPKEIDAQNIASFKEEKKDQDEVQKFDPPALHSDSIRPRWSRRCRSVETKRNTIAPKRKASLSPTSGWGSFFSRSASRDSSKSSGKSASKHKRKLAKKVSDDMQRMGLVGEPAHLNPNQNQVQTISGQPNKQLASELPRDPPSNLKVVGLDADLDHESSHSIGENDDQEMHTSTVEANFEQKNNADPGDESIHSIGKNEDQEMHTSTVDANFEQKNNADPDDVSIHSIGKNDDQEMHTSTVEASFEQKNNADPDDGSIQSIDKNDDEEMRTSAVEANVEQKNTTGDTSESPQEKQVASNSVIEHLMYLSRSNDEIGFLDSENDDTSTSVAALVEEMVENKNDTEQTLLDDVRVTNEDAAENVHLRSAADDARPPSYDVPTRVSPEVATALHKLGIFKGMTKDQEGCKEQSTVRSTLSSTLEIPDEEVSRLTDESDDDSGSSCDELEDFQSSIMTGPIQEAPIQQDVDEHNDNKETKGSDRPATEHDSEELHIPLEQFIGKLDGSKILPPPQSRWDSDEGDVSPVQYVHRTMGAIKQPIRVSTPSYPTPTLPSAPESAVKNSNLRGSPSNQSATNTSSCNQTPKREKEATEHTIPSNVVAALQKLGIVKSSQLVFEAQRGVGDAQRSQGSRAAVDRVVNLYQKGHISKTEYLALRKQALMEEEITQRPTHDSQEDESVEERLEYDKASMFRDSTTTQVEEPEAVYPNTSSLVVFPTQRRQLMVTPSSLRIVAAHKDPSRPKATKKFSRKKHAESASVCSKGSAAGSRRSLKRRLTRKKMKELRSDWELPRKETALMHSVVNNTVGLEKAKRKFLRSSKKEQADIINLLGVRKETRKKKEDLAHQSSSDKLSRKSSWDSVVGKSVDNAIRAKSDRSRAVAAFLANHQGSRSSSYRTTRLPRDKGVSSIVNNGSHSVGKVDIADNMIGIRRHKSEHPRSRLSPAPTERQIRPKSESSRSSKIGRAKANGLITSNRNTSRQTKSRLNDDPRYDPTVLVACVADADDDVSLKAPPSRSVDLGDMEPIPSKLSISRHSSRSSELRSQKRQQEGVIKKRLRSLDRSVSNSKRAAAVSDPALQRVLELAKLDTQRKRDKLRALKANTDLSQAGFPMSAVEQPPISSHEKLTRSSNKKERDSSRRSSKLEKNQRRSTKKLSTSTRGKEANNEAVEGSKTKRRKTTRLRSSKKDSTHQRRSSTKSKSLPHGGERSKSHHTSPARASTARSTGVSLVDYLDKDQKERRRGSVQDLIERSVASPRGDSFRKRNKSKTEGSTNQAATSDILHHFTEKYKALQQEKDATLNPRFEQQVYAEI